MACCLNTHAMEMTDEVVCLRLESIRRAEPQTEQHVHQALLWDITRVHPPLLPPSSVAFQAERCAGSLS